MRKFIVFANGNLGLEVLRVLINSTENQVVGVVLNSDSKISNNYQEKIINLISKSKVDCEVFHYSENLWGESIFLQRLQTANFAVSALFGHKIPLSVINHFGKNIVNLHPSLLPIGRGSDPVAWAIIEDNPQGATLHEIDAEIDTGKILMQTQIETYFSDTSGEIYSKSTEVLLELFKQYLSSDLRRPTIPQKPLRGTFRTSKELKEIRENLLLGNAQFEYVLRTVQALNYSDGRRAQIRLQNGQIWEISIKARLVSEQDNQ